MKKLLLSVLTLSAITFASSARAQDPADVQPLPANPAGSATPAAQPIDAPAPAAPIAATLSATPAMQPAAPLPAPFRDKPSAPFVSREQAETFWNVDVGVRVGYVRDPRLDPFSSNDVVPQWTFRGQRTLFARGRTSIAAGLAWDIGGTSATTRGADAGMFANRFSVPVDVRENITPYFYAFARFAPGVNLINVHVNDNSASSTLTDTGWAFSADASVGASYVLGTHAQTTAPRFWVTPEFGYGWATESNLRLTPKDTSNLEGSYAPTDLGALALRGVFWRVGVGVTF